ncbi:MAG: SDR family oxidoreductase [Myxococcales bacterium]|nr:MAG: SDR family oxidoreductase [Myxococcales bacterium]
MTASRPDWPEGRYLVTGGAGFIGSNLAEAIAASGRPVRVADNFITGRRENLAGLDGVLLIEGDLRDPGVCRAAIAGVDYVLHQAALGSVPRSMTDPLATHSHNATATLNVFWAAQQAGVKRVVYAASSSAYGDTPTLPKEEAMTPRPMSPYAASKLAGEFYAQVFARSYGLETVSLRYFNVFGRRQDPESQYAAAIPRFVRKLLAGGRPTIFGDGEQTRDFTYIDNVVEANRLALLAPKEAVGETCNIACGERVTMNELASTLARLIGVAIQPEHAAARPGDIRHSLADISKAERLLGYRPQILFAEGLARTIEWYRQTSR